MSVLKAMSPYFVLRVTRDVGVINDYKTFIRTIGYICPCRLWRGGGTSVADNPPVADNPGGDEPTDNPPVADNPPLTPEECGKWCSDRMNYVTSTSPTSVISQIQGYDSTQRQWQVMGRKPDQSYTYYGDIEGEINPDFSHLSDPKIFLEVSSDKNSITADITFYVNGADARYSNFSAELLNDGTFSSFRGDDPNGFNGAFFGEYNALKSLQNVAGHVITPQVYGTYHAY